jgi:ClpX C4-type zinc finger protein
MPMVLDSALLTKARAARAEILDAELKAHLAAAEYHTAIRRLHLAGGSLREIAQALELSHQRVQQIVRGAGGTWWRKVWAARGKRTDAICSWCNRPPSEVKKLIAGPNVHICDRCIEEAERSAAGKRGKAGAFELSKTARLRSRCSFCAKGVGDERSLLIAPAGNICTDCLRMCRDIVEHSGG